MKADQEMFHITKICRLRIKTDGEGIRTLVVTNGCNLHCKYCINPQTWDGAVEKHTMSAAKLYKTIALDRPYFMATGGGVTFGGGEPLLYSKQIREFKELCKGEFSIYAETSLNVPATSVREAYDCIDRFYIDIKTLDPQKYKEYTQGNLSVSLTNLSFLLEQVNNENIIVRIPTIPGLTSAEDQVRDREKLEDMGVCRFDLFSYVVP